MRDHTGKITFDQIDLRRQERRAFIVGSLQGAVLGLLGFFIVWQALVD